MSEEVTSNPGLGTGEVASESTPVEPTPVETPSVETPTEVTPPEQMSEKEAGILRELQQTRDELKREREYREFLAESSKYQDKTQVAPEEFNPAPDSILYASEVDKLVEQKASKIVTAELLRIEAERTEAELRSMADELRKSDTNFDERMGYAVELVERDPLCAREFDRAKGADGKIKALERIAKFHPKYHDGLSTKQATQNTAVSDAVAKMKENANKPITLSGVGNSGTVEKQYSQMTDDEYIKAFKEVTKGY